MDDSWYSVEQVAERLGLHVRTVRGYIREGRLAAVRIGKQYRIAQADLDALTGRPAARAPARAEVSAVVEIEDVPPAAADRIGTLLVAGAQLIPDLRVRTIHDEARSRLKVIVLGSPAATADLLGTLADVLRPESGIL
ncbi:helix-turn-helix domain-containing protein [Actinoplanes sp. NPDC051494]|uniref:helix-turn-helix domain-containing protein n=1 Tax=Actinoplanes sp. NPDC051494 TaxID=3363907 RepID=UPI00379CF4B5